MPQSSAPESSRRHSAIARRFAFVVVAVGALSGAPRASHAQRAQVASTPGVHTSFAGTTPRVTFGYQEIFDADTIHRMRSGLEVTIVMRAWAYPERGGDAIGFAARSCRVAYDIWEEHYRVEVLDPEGLRTIAVPDAHSVVDQCGQVRGLPLRMSRPLGPAEAFRVQSVAEVDPLTPDMVARIQRWVAHPGEAAPTPAEPEGTFFGAFVALFVNPTVGEAERTVRIDSGLQVAP